MFSEKSQWIWLDDSIRLLVGEYQQEETAKPQDLQLTLF